MVRSVSTNGAEAKYLAVYYQSGDNLLLDSTENEVNLSKIYRMFDYLKTIIYICSNINII